MARKMRGALQNTPRLDVMRKIRKIWLGDGILVRVDSERATSTSTHAQQFCRTISQVVERSREDFFTLTLPPLLHHSIPRRSSGARLQLLRPEASGACPPRGCCSSKELLLLFCPYIACYLAHDGWGIEEDGISG